MEALTCLTNEYSLRADMQGARRCALRQLELDPWREEAHCQLMRVLALEGQRSAALVQYDTCRRVLADMLGVEPSKQTRELYEQIRSGGLNPKADLPFSVEGHKLPVSLTPFIGREHELAQLAVLIADATCRCITLVGPGGIGKTRLRPLKQSFQPSQMQLGLLFMGLLILKCSCSIICGKNKCCCSWTTWSIC